MKKIAEIEASFAPSKNNLKFDVQNKTGFISLVTSADQLAQVAQLLLLAGNGKTFTVRFYDSEKKGNSEGKKEKIKGPKQKSELRRRTVDR